MHKKILTIEDLVKFCEQQNFTTFSAKESGYQICVQVPAQFSKVDYDNDNLLIGDVVLLHTGNNRNGSNVTEEAAKKCMDSIAYKPILANFTDVDGELDFTSHDFELNDDGSVTYYEKQVGCFTADEPYMKEDSEHKGRIYVYARCAIPRQYTAAADIIERKEGTKLSAELGINKMSYDSKEKALLLEDIVLWGATLLGKDPNTGKEIDAGMENARLDIADFSADNNSSVTKAELIEEITQAIVTKLDNHIANNFADNNQRKEERGLEDFEKNVDVTEETEEFTETVESETTTEEETPEVVDTFDGDGETSGDTSDGDDADDTDDTDDADDSDEPEEGSNEVENEHGDQNGKKSFSINGMTFEVSLSEIQFSICELVNNTYSESDNDYYYVEVYEGSKTVVMSGAFTGRSYRQGYKVRNGVYSLTGDRVPVKAVYVTADEEAELDKMRSNFAIVSEKLAKYEAEPEKMAILESADYANIAGQDDFEELKKCENHFDLSVDDVKDKADAMLLQYAKSGRLNFAANEQPKKEIKTGGFFAFATREEKNTFLDSLLKK